MFKLKAQNNYGQTSAVELEELQKITVNNMALRIRIAHTPKHNTIATDNNKKTEQAEINKKSIKTNIRTADFARHNNVTN